MTEPTDATPLDVAVQLDPVERHKYSLSLAARHGFEGSAMDTFADRLKGSTRSDLETDAADFAAVIESIRADLTPPRVMAVDPSQGIGPPPQRKSDRDRFAETLYNSLHF